MRTKNKTVTPVELPLPGSKEREALEIRLGDMAAGKISAPSPMTTYLLKQYQQGRNEFMVIQNTIQEVQANLQRLQTRQTLLEGVVNKYADDLRYWVYQELPRITAGSNPPTPQA